MVFFCFTNKSNALAEYEAKIDAIDRSQAVIEFDMDGNVLAANANFLAAMGYDWDDIKGKHHSLFVEPSFRDGAGYKEFWAALKRGEFQAAEFKRLGKGGREVWIQASYNPIFNGTGRPYKVVKIATDVTESKRKSADFAGQIDAINKAQAVIEFQLDGTVITANANFLAAMGYRLDEVQGRHHSMFVEVAERDGAGYRAFWAALVRGEHQTAEYRRIGKGGREVWIQASYNPILDTSGKPFKVVKFATDVTQEKLKNADYAGQLAAINKAQAVIEFKLDGTIITANANFLAAMGYRLEEVQGRHHSMFVEDDYRNSAGYKEFWASLGRGEYQAAEYKRVGKGGREVFIQASYNPILDMNGRPYKVVKFATDVTKAVLARKKAEHVRGLMEATAAGTEELNVSVREISASMVKSRDVADDAYNQTVAADRAAQRLDSAAQSMGGIIDAITAITGQINLLSLNATIESARAGEAGKGFAVVANEVKNLAAQARRATEEISGEVSNMLSVATEVTDALNAIKHGIENVREYVGSTAAAVEEQSTVANEMSASMQRAAEEANAMG